MNPANIIEFVLTVVVLILILIEKLLKVVNIYSEKKAYKEAWKHTLGDLSVQEVVDKIEELKRRRSDDISTD